MLSGVSVPSSRHQTDTVWYAVTVRVAWDLMVAGVRVRPNVLQDARDHALCSLPKGLGVDEAEHCASALTRSYLERVTEGRYRRDTSGSDLSVHADRSWRTQLFEAVDPVGDAVLRMHFGDGLDMEGVERTAAIDGAVLGGAKEGIREAMRAIADADGHGVTEWTDVQVDALIARVVCMAAPGCPEVADLMTHGAAMHVDQCTRCSRAVRLIRGGILSAADLLNQPVDFEPIELATVLLHPDGQKHRKRLQRLMVDIAVPAGTDVWLLDARDLRKIEADLRVLAVEARPPRHHTRGAVVSGLGRWSGKTLLGPVAMEALAAARARPWGVIEGLDELPAPRPPPPRATRWWVSATLCAIASVVAGVEVFMPAEPPPITPIEVHFKRIDPGWDVRFDADELAIIDVLILGAEGPELLHASVGVKKGQWATGEGDFHFAVKSDTVALIASETGIPNLAQRVMQSRGQPEPMAAIASWIRQMHPEVDFVVSPEIVMEEGDGLPTLNPPFTP